MTIPAAFMFVVTFFRLGYGALQGLIGTAWCFLGMSKDSFTGALQAPFVSKNLANKGASLTEKVAAPWLSLCTSRLQALAARPKAWCAGLASAVALVTSPGVSQLKCAVAGCLLADEGKDSITSA